jgi:hypothetical protein
MVVPHNFSLFVACVLQSPKAGTREDQFRTFEPNFVLVRKLVRGLTPYAPPTYSHGIQGP